MAMLQYIIKLHSHNAHIKLTHRTMDRWRKNIIGSRNFNTQEEGCREIWDIQHESLRLKKVAEELRKFNTRD